METYDIHFIDSFLKSLQKRFSKHEFILAGFPSLLPTDPGRLADGLLDSLVLFYQNCLSAPLTELVFEFKLWYRRLARLDKGRIAKTCNECFTTS